MDVEENEAFVLHGGINTLARSGYPPILFESNGENPGLFGFIRMIGYNIITVGGCNNMYLACDHRS